MTMQIGVVFDDRRGIMAPMIRTRMEPAEQDRLFFGLLVRKSLWIPSWYGGLVLIVIACTTVYIMFHSLYGYLALVRPVEADLLVVEGWIPESSLQLAVKEFQTGAYRQIIATGGPVQANQYLTQYETGAELTAARLCSMGVPDSLVIAVPAPEVRRDRTWAAAQAFADWVNSRNNEIRGINILSTGPHTRRTFLLFRKALESGYPMGSIAVDDPSYSSRNWFRESAGVRTMINEVIAYGYVILLFNPDR